MLSRLRSHWGMALVLLLGVIFCRAALLRDFWFDEALTVLNFALLPDPATIYHSYIIPNNQIVYTVIVHYLNQFNLFGYEPVAWLRFGSLIAGLGTMALLYYGFRATVGGRGLIASILMFFAVSPIFCNYATAVRGYMWSMFFVVLALLCGRRMLVSPSWKNRGLFFLAALLTVGTIPSNLLALVGVGLYLWPLCGGSFWKRMDFYLLGLIPAGAFALFYLPIVRQFMGCLQLGEGWQNRYMALGAVYGAFALSFLIPLAGALVGGIYWSRRKKKINVLFCMRIAIFLLPIPACFLLKAAPFPRVFSVLFPLWILLVAHGVKHLAAWRKKWRPSPALWLFPALLTAAFATQSGAALSVHFGGRSSDDYFAPYYMRITHRMDRVANFLKRHALEDRGVYISFRSDPWAIIFHGMLSGANVEHWRFDGPRGQVPNLSEGTMVVLRPDEAPGTLEKRFGVRLEEVFKMLDEHVFWRVRPAVEAK